ncbi:PH domain-containing protein [Pseudovibrio sp. JE062]|uniref:PH domain-containing protein n=1 Tax=Pseudovibrio sp. JE062 TaxID=439495 RepID=UPI0018DB1B66|nr:PH domain-containing protein [Pseudovibrio sp. JE062]
MVGNIMFDYKNASKKELKEEYNRIAADMGDDQFFTKKELNYLPEVLMDGEQVLAFTSGLMDGNTWLITLTDKRVIFLDKGMLFGLKQTTVDLDKVNAISGKTGLMFGEIVITDGATDREIKNVWKKTVKPFTNKVQAALEARKQPVSQGSQEVDVYDKIGKLASLMEKGLLSEEEFNVEKAKLLSS